MQPIEKMETLAKIHEAGVVAVVRVKDPDQARGIVGAVFEGGIPAVEVTMTVPGAVKIIEALAAEYRGTSLVLGAGTVLDPETARACLLAGARYIVAPNLDEGVIRLCNRYAVPCMPGIGSVTELVRAYELGADVVKVFPGEVLGPKFIKAALAPVPHAKMIPTGGVSLDNLGEWFDAGAYAVGMGTALTKPAGRDGDLDAVRATAKSVVERIRQIRSLRGRNR